MFTYKELDTITHNGGRWYLSPTGAYPSITTVLGNTQPPEKVKILQDWRDSIGHAEADAHSKKATDHGTMVHLLVERFLLGQDVEAPVDGLPVPAYDLGAFRTLKQKLKKINAVWGQEQALHSAFLRVAGRFDCIGEYDGVPSVIDFKTSGRVKGREDISDYELQLCFYAMAHNELFGTNIEQGVILMVAAGGFPIEFKIPIAFELQLKLGARIDQYWSTAVPPVLAK